MSRQVIRQSGRGGASFSYSRLCLMPGEFLGAAVLAPPLCGAVLVEDERGVSATCPDPVLLELLAAAPFQASAAAAARSRASSTGLLTMGQWPESMSMK